MRRPEKPGTIVQIDLGDGYHTYGRELKSPYAAFYDAKTSDRLSLEEIIGKPVLFIVVVFDESFLEWKQIGYLPLQTDEIPIPELFTQNVGNAADIRLLDADGNDRPGNLEMIQGLERAAVWDRENVEQRIQDHYAGVPNLIVELQKPKPIIDIPDYFNPLYKKIVEPVLIKSGYQPTGAESKLSDQHYAYSYAKANTPVSEIRIETKVSRGFFWLKVGTNLGTLRDVAQYPNSSPTNVFDDKDWLFREQADLESALQDITVALSRLFDAAPD